MNLRANQTRCHPQSRKAKVLQELQGKVVKRIHPERVFQCHPKVHMSRTPRHLSRTVLWRRLSNHQVTKARGKEKDKIQEKAWEREREKGKVEILMMNPRKGRKVQPLTPQRPRKRLRYLPRQSQVSQKQSIYLKNQRNRTFIDKNPRVFNSSLALTNTA